MFSLTGRDQRLLGLGLVLLMALTRGQHFASIDALPSASWAVFFLAGMFLQPRWSFPLLFLQAVLLDISAVGLDAAAAHCITPAYVMLLPAYASLWLGGRVYARLHQGATSLRVLVLTLVPLLLITAFVSNLFSSGGYYYLSGLFDDPSLMGLGERIVRYWPARLPPLFGYVVIVGLSVGGWQWRARAHRALSH